MFIYINTLKLSTLIIYSSKTLFFLVTLLIIYSSKTLTIFHHVFNKSAQGEEADFEINSVILWWSQIRVCIPIDLQQIQTVYCSGLAIGIVSLWGNSAHRKIRESFLGSAGVVRCPIISNQCTFWLANQQAGK